MRTYAQLTTSFVVFCNRVGVDESISFWGGSEVIAPTGEALLHGAALRGGPVHRRRRRSPTSGASGSRCRCSATSGRSCEVRELSRIVAERAGLAADTTADAGAEPGLDVAPGEPVGRPIGFRPDDRPRRDATAGRAPADGRLFELPAELAIDTDVARRVIGEFIRGQLRQAGFERARPRPVGRDRLGARRLPDAPRRSARSGCCAS